MRLLALANRMYPHVGLSSRNVSIERLYPTSNVDDSILLIKIESHDTELDCLGYCPSGKVFASYSQISDRDVTEAYREFGDTPQAMQEISDKLFTYEIHEMPEPSFLKHHTKYGIVDSGIGRCYSPVGGSIPIRKLRYSSGYSQQESPAVEAIYDLYLRKYATVAERLAEIKENADHLRTFL